MDKISRIFATILTFGITMSCLTLLAVESSNAQTISTPSIPQFTLKLVNASYITTSTNSYTGQSQSQLINNDSIEITIKNQPFGYINNSLDYQIYFNIRVKPHFSTNDNNWTEIYPLRNLTSSKPNENGFTYARYILPESPVQSNQEYTTISFPFMPTTVYGASGFDVQRSYTGQNALLPTFLYAVPIDAQLDFQIQALVGHNSTYWYIEHPIAPTVGGYSVSAVAYDLASGWSNTQIITIGDESPSPSPTVPEFPIQIVMPLLVAVPLIAVIILRKRSIHE